MEPDVTFRSVWELSRVLIVFILILGSLAKITRSQISQLESDHMSRPENETNSR